VTDPVDRYAVFGNPISHSRSPLIHSLFAQQTGQRMTYTAELVPTDGFDAAVAAFARNGGKGLNITVPFKQQAFALANRKSARAERAGAVNTLMLHAPGDYYGDTTDGIGLVRDLIRNHHNNLNGKKILVLGAGGAVRGVLEPLLGNLPAQLTIANRTRATAVQLAKDFSDLGDVRGCGLDETGSNAFDIIINGTSASLGGELPPLSCALLHQHTFCYDMMYAAAATPFMRWGRENGCAETADGLGMLVEQAAESFRIWRGVDPVTGPVIEAVRRILNQPDL
jgi:shikimate dehydrogenase